MAAFMIGPNHLGSFSSCANDTINLLASSDFFGIIGEGLFSGPTRIDALWELFSFCLA